MVILFRVAVPYSPNLTPVMEKKIISIRLKRQLSTIDMFNEDHVRSNLLISYTVDKAFKLAKIPILENRKYLFPDGVYELRYEHSPKFNTKLWEIYGIPNRSEIKFYTGKRTEHSRGWPLTTTSGLARLHNVLDTRKNYCIIVQSN